jgi:hypothetical protein
LPEHRVVVTAAVLAVGFIAIAIVMLSLPTQQTYDLAAQSSRSVELTQSFPPACGDHELQEHIRALMLAGLESALRDRIQTLYEVWMKDETDQPRRARNGTLQGISAYIRARDAITKWTLEPCK